MKQVIVAKTSMGEFQGQSRVDPNGEAIHTNSHINAVFSTGRYSIFPDLMYEEDYEKVIK